MDSSWIIIPVVNNLDLTKNAVADALAQEGLAHPARVLLIGNNVSPEMRKGLEEIQADNRRRVLAVYHTQALGGPPFGCLNATWNRALDFVWALGGADALVINNDVRLHPKTYACLRAAQFASEALFVSAVGVKEEDWVKVSPREECFNPGWWLESWDRKHKGGPDFSCYLITKECHQRFRMDPGFTFCGDLDYHRTLMLAGEQARIFSVNVPYLHYASQTLRRNPDFARKYQQTVDAHRALYAKKWGGPVNAEEWNTPYGGERPHDAVCTTTPDLQGHGCAGFHPDGGTALHRNTPIPKPWDNASPDGPS